MIYLINKGVESALAFTIMESVRKGKGLNAGVGGSHESAGCA